jgi:hypothetical protein
MVKRMMSTDPEWAPTLMRRTDIDLTVDEEDPTPAAARPPRPVQRAEVVAIDFVELEACPVCKLKTFDTERGACMQPDCAPPPRTYEVDGFIVGPIPEANS